MFKRIWLAARRWLLLASTIGTAHAQESHEARSTFVFYSLVADLAAENPGVAKQFLVGELVFRQV